MRQPITYTLLLPLLIFCIMFFNNYWLLAFALITVLLFSIEIRIKYGNLSKKSISAFFNTPIQGRDLLGENIVDNRPKVSTAKGALIIVGAGILAVAILFFLFGIISH